MKACNGSAVATALEELPDCACHVLDFFSPQPREHGEREHFPGPPLCFRKVAFPDKRAEQYRQNVKSSFEDESRGWEDESSFEFGDYETYLRREKEYMTILMKCSPSLAKTITRSSMKAACKSFIDNSCKRYVFSKKDFVRIISPWLVNKNIEFQRDLKLGYDGD